MNFCVLNSFEKGTVKLFDIKIFGKPIEKVVINAAQKRKLKQLGEWYYLCCENKGKMINFAKNYNPPLKLKRPNLRWQISAPKKMHLNLNEVKLIGLIM